MGRSATRRLWWARSGRRPRERSRSRSTPPARGNDNGHGHGHGHDDGHGNDGHGGGGCGPLLATVGGTLVGPGATYASASFTPPGAGSYLWVASFAGDAGNDAAAGRCGAQGETSVVDRASPTIATTPSAGVSVGGVVSDQASLTGAFNPTGRVTFRLYSDSGCHRRVFGSTGPLSGTSATSAGFTTTRVGIFYWQASYRGDRNNRGFTTPCGPGRRR